jgi:hypothetical protein
MDECEKIKLNPNNQAGLLSKISTYFVSVDSGIFARMGKELVK